jgi:hypothetical protein
MSYATLSIRGGYTMKLMKFKFQDPSLAWSPSMALVGALVIFWK